MKQNKSNHEKELMELKHDPVPGYRPVFLVVFTLSLLYMAFILTQPYF
jgi:hypothetical protein